MKTIASRFVVPALLLLAMTSSAVVSAAVPETTEDGLVLVKKTRADVVYRRPDATFGGYTKIQLIEPQIAFEKSWKSDYNLENPRNKVSDADMAAMIAKGREMLLQEYAKALTKGGYALVGEAGKDTLAVKISLLDLKVSVPDPSNSIGSWNKTYSDEGGSATLVIELYDSTTHQLLARAFDRKGDGDNSYGWGSRDQRTNTADVSYAFRSWAEMFVQGLDRAKKAEASGK